MELKLNDGDYIPDGGGGLSRLSGAEEVLGRVMFRLTARRGGLPFLPGLGSRLWQVWREKPSVRQALAAQYVAEALEEETEVNVTGVEWKDLGQRGEITVYLDWNGKRLTAEVEV